jgi:hypothetical protein
MGAKEMPLDLVLIIKSMLKTLTKFLTNHLNLLILNRKKNLKKLKISVAFFSQFDILPMLIERRENIMKEALQNLRNRMIEDYNDWTNRCAKGELSETNLEMMRQYEEEIEFVEGRKYIKVIQNRSAWGFIVATDDDKLFEKGDILMAAGYNKPARNKARGNIFDLDNTRVQWTGANYL